MWASNRSARSSERRWAASNAYRMEFISLLYCTLFRSRAARAKCRGSKSLVHDFRFNEGGRGGYGSSIQGSEIGLTRIAFCGLPASKIRVIRGTGPRWTQGRPYVRFSTLRRVPRTLKNSKSSASRTAGQKRWPARLRSRPGWVERDSGFNESIPRGPLFGPKVVFGWCCCRRGSGPKVLAVRESPKHCPSVNIARVRCEAAYAQRSKGCL